MKPPEIPDLLIVGAGIFGLWAARHAIKAGKTVHIYDKRKIGAGASGGFLGALMPHLPDAWNAKKQMQFEALTALPDMLADLEAETGVDCEFRRCGRLMPTLHHDTLKLVDDRVEGARDNWRKLPANHELDLTKLTPPLDKFFPENWLAESFCSYGAAYDNFSARINPRAYLSALNQFVSSRAQLFEETEICAIDPDKCHAGLKDGSWVKAGHIMIASGFEAYPMLQPYFGPLNGGRRIGRGVKGQAVLLEFDHDDTLPIVFHDGAYVVPHKNNRIAIGSSSEGDWQGSPHDFSSENLTFYNRAMELVPSLSQAPIVERWAGVRPRNTLGEPWTLTSGTDPYVGLVPGQENISVAVGGFKISLGIAHWLTGKLDCCK